MRTVVRTMVEVPLDDGSTWTGTEAELRAQHPGWVKYARIVQPTRTTRQEDDIEGDFADDPHPGRLPTSSRRYAPIPGQKRVEYEFQDEIVHTSIPPRRSATQQQGNPNKATPPDTIYGQPARQRYTEEPRRRRGGLVAKFRAHPLLTLGIGMLLMFGLWVGLNALVSWWNVTQDDWHYGRPRTAQYDVLVGHNDDPSHMTHIIAVNLNRRVIIIELPGGDYSKARIYKGPVLLGQGADLAPVTLTFSDPGNSGHPEMLVHVQDATFIYLNQRVNGVWQFVTPQT